MHAPAPLRIGTRGSALALTQANGVADRLRALGVAVGIETITTRGDASVQGPVATLGGDGVFVRELERALLEGRIDVAVHSLKDLPTAETPGLALACVPERATPFDVLVGRTAPTLAALPPKAVVGTSSIRRVVQVRALRPDVVVRPIRGNVDTRLRRLDAGECDALVLAGAGLERLGLAGRVTEVLRPDAFWPAVSQGALGLQSRADDARTLAAVAQLDHAASHAAVVAERACLAALAGGCLAPIGGWARMGASRGLVLGACVLEEADGVVHRLGGEGAIPCDEGNDVSIAAAGELGRRVAADLLARGAALMLARARGGGESGNGTT
ncbi:MAG: hydroxymethylbilane synthase [Planctomycetaceae bacterium]